jgi:glycosyltransferase involved in cell wall biosynthesis
MRKKMLISSNIEAFVMINDIGLNVPPKGKGPVRVSDDKAASSKHLIDLVRSNVLTVSESNGAIVKKDLDGETVWVINGHVMWGGNGVSKLDQSRMKEMLSDSLLQIHAEEMGGVRKYLVRNTSDCTMFIEKAGLTLNRFMTKAHLDSDAFFDSDTQRAIVEGKLELEGVIESSIDENGHEVWLALGLEDVGTPSPESLESVCCFWEGPIFDAGGYANMNRQYVFNLNALGAKVKPALTTTLMDVETKVRNEIMRLSETLIPIASPKVYATNVPNTHVGRSVSYTMMETENKIHDLLVHKLCPADEIWVPSEWNKQSFENSNVRRDIRVMPLGVDTDTYKPRSQKVFWGDGTKDFVFLSVFNWNWRKGYDIMLKAYSRAFTDEDNVSFVMLSRYVGQTGGAFTEKIYNDVSEIVSSEKNTNSPHLILIDEVIPTALMPYIYNSADAFIFVTRGEGWGLPACEAAASGLPVISADHGGQKMFLNNDNSLLVKPDKTTVVDKSIEWISPFYHGMDFIDFSDSAIDELADIMRHAYEEKESLSDMADNCRNNILENFTWKKAAERVYDRLKEIQP